MQRSDARQRSLDAIDEASIRALAGGVMLGAGIAAVVVGTVLRLRADPSDRYDRPAGWAFSAGFGDVSLRGTF